MYISIYIHIHDSPMRTQRKGVEATVAPKLIQHINIRPHVIKIVAIRRIIGSVPLVAARRILPDFALT